MAESYERTNKAAKGIGIAAGAVNAIPIFGQIASAILGATSGAMRAGAAAKEARAQEEELRKKREEELVDSLSTSSGSGGTNRATRSSNLGSVFGNQGTGVGTIGGQSSGFSVMGAMNNNLQLQKPTAEPLDNQKQNPERPNMGTPQQPGQQQQDLPQQQNATPQMGSGGQQGQEPLGSELSSIFTGLGSGGGGFYG